MEREEERKRNNNNNNAKKCNYLFSNSISHPICLFIWLGVKPHLFKEVSSISSKTQHQQIYVDSKHATIGSMELIKESDKKTKNNTKNS